MKTQNGKLRSIKNGIEYSFLYEYIKIFDDVYDGEAYIFEVWEKGKELDEKFSFRLKIMDNGHDLKVVDLFSSTKKYYLGKGISVSMIKEVKFIFNKRIISSSNNHPTFSHEQRWPDAENKVWQRLVDSNEAAYDEEKDYFYTI